MKEHPDGDDIAAVCIFAIGAIAILFLMWDRSILESIASAIIQYVRDHQAI